MTALVRYRIRLVAELNHWVRGFDAGRQERRQEYKPAFSRLAVRHHRSDSQRPQRRDLIGVRPSHRWIVDLVARSGELQHQPESDRSTGNALANLVFEIVGSRLGALVLRQEMSAGVGKQLIAPNRHGALFVDELEAVHAEVGGRRVADWWRIPRGQEPSSRLGASPGRPRLASATGPLACCRQPPGRIAETPRGSSPESRCTNG